MEEKYKEYKKSKMYKKKIIMNIFLVLLFAVIVYLIVNFYLASSPKKNINPNKNYFYEIENDVVYLKSSDGLEGTYKCNDHCKIYTRDTFIGYFSKGRILLQDGVNIYLYDLLNSKKLTSNYSWIDYIYDDEGTELENIKMFKVKDSFSKHGVIDLNGNVLVAVTYDEIGKTIEEKLINYNYQKDYITARRGEKWGIIGLSNGKGLIDFQYADIKLSPYGKIAAKDGDLWTLVDESNKRLINKGYSSIDIHEEHLVVSEDNKAFVMDFLGNVTSNKIDLHFKVDTWATITVKGLSSFIEKGKLYINVDEPLDPAAGTHKTIKYYYDAENNEIKLVD